MHAFYGKILSERLGVQAASHSHCFRLCAHKLVDTVVVMFCLIPTLGSVSPSSRCILPQCAGEPGRSADVPTATTVSSPPPPHTHIHTHTHIAALISRRCKYCIACRLLLPHCLLHSVSALLAGESLGTKHYLPLSTTIYHDLPLSTTIYHYLPLTM